MVTWHALNRGISRHPLVIQHASDCKAEIQVGISADPGAERIGWGYKASGLWAKRSGNYRLFEDGFVRSLRPGYGAGAIYSLVEDRTGIYYDVDGQSDLITTLYESREVDPDTPDLLRRFIDLGISKYNWFPFEHQGPLIEETMPEPGILVIDQTAGDTALRYGGCSADSFANLLREALDLSGDSPVYVRTHPDVAMRSRRSCFPSDLLREAKVTIVPSDYPPAAVFPRVTEVWVFNSLLGMEALLHGCSVRVYGRPFYAGWGLTQEAQPDPTLSSSGLDSVGSDGSLWRGRRLSLSQVFQAAYLDYTRYFDPQTREPCGFDRILDHLDLQKSKHRENRHEKLLFGFPAWKSRLVGDFLTSPGSRCTTIRLRKRVERWRSERPDGEIHVWSTKPTSLPESARLVRVEDGFLRSVGLGADFHQPISLVFDRSGMYFDASSPSDLEKLLQTHDFSAADLEAAETLIQLLVKKRITKYNLMGPSLASWPEQGRRKILVPGQVESDASLQFGRAMYPSNLEFLRAVREAHPNDTIAYKPHPDLLKKLRPGAAILQELDELSDQIITDLDIIPWLETCDQIHTQTSLAGFEALLRRKPVICYGQPFYSGWGLTEDRFPLSRRSRRLTLLQLVAGALIHYPTYIHPETREFITALDAASYLAGADPDLFSRPYLFRAFASFKRIIHPLRD